MIFFPAIDLKEGVCVRLIKGDMEKATVFNDSPADQARQFVAAAADWIHVVDLNGAVAGAPVNKTAVKDIISAGIPVQLGGGIRDMAAIEAWLTAEILTKKKREGGSTSLSDSAMRAAMENAAQFGGS